MVMNMEIKLISKRGVVQAIKKVDPKMRVSKDFYESLNERVAKLVEDAVKRAKGNDRRTVRAVDV